MPLSKKLNQASKIAIIGNGAIGNLLAFRCHQLDYDYGVVTRDNQKIELDVSDIDNKHYRFPLPVTSINSIAESDIIIVPIKAYQVADFIEQAHRYIKPWQTIVLLHNGMGTIEQVQQQLPHNNLLAATTTYGAFKPQVNQLAIKGHGETQLGWIQRNITIQTTKIENMLSALLPPSNWHADILFSLWLKLAINAAINPLSALHEVKNGELAQAKYQIQIAALCDEITLIMQHLGFELESDRLINAVKHVIQQTRDNYSSMNRDLQAKRKTEINFINGYIVEQAARFNLPCPVNLALCTEIRQQEVSTQ
jgi:2-dehydropantoate 2-reductase